jgi:hypothetical protein
MLALHAWRQSEHYLFLQRLIGGITPELSRTERIASNMISKDNDDKHAIEASRSNDLLGGGLNYSGWVSLSFELIRGVYGTTPDFFNY